VEAAGNPAAANRGDRMSAMDRWIMTVCADLGLDPGAADARAILDMTRTWPITSTGRPRRSPRT
jgi:hypothetical protein